MGCDESTPSEGQNNQKPIIASEVFAELKLQHLIKPEYVFENDLEKDIFMAINVCRSEPAVFVSVVNSIKENNPLCKNAKYTDKLIKMLEMNEQLGAITYDVAAFDAARQNNRV